MIQKTINLYNFNELSKDVQNRVIEKFRNDTDIDDLYFLEYDMQYEIDELLKENNIIKELERYYIETATSDESITKNINANEYWFTETGELTTP